MKISGYAAVYNNIDGGNDIIAPGAFDQNIADRPPYTIPLLFNHDAAALPIGRLLEIESDEKGLKFTGELFPDRWARAARVPADYLSRGGIGASIGYVVREAEKRADGVRVLKRLELYEISLTPIPMNSQAQVAQMKALASVEYLECAAMTVAVAAIVAALAA